MNWEKLNTDYPKASNMMYKWIKENRGKFEGVWMRFSIHKIGKVDNFFTPHGYRWLYDFFDENLILISIKCSKNLNFTAIIEEFIKDESGIEFMESHSFQFYEKREIVEALAFEKAFVILEDYQSFKD